MCRVVGGVCPSHTLHSGVIWDLFCGDLQHDVRCRAITLSRSSCKEIVSFVHACTLPCTFYSYKSHWTVTSHKKFELLSLPQMSTMATTHFSMFEILILNSQSTFYSNWYWEPDWLYKIRIVNICCCCRRLWEWRQYKFLYDATFQWDP
jgi:hypothetical protein